MLLFLLIVSKFILSDGRVFCQDSFARPWTPMGKSCPVSCNAVITAVNKLKLLDYNRWLNQRMRQNISISDSELMTIGKHLKINAMISRRNDRNAKLNKYITLAYQKLFKNKTFVQDFKSEINKMVAEFKNRTCHQMAAENPLKNKILRHKSARSIHNNQEILKRITDILNRYSDKYMFTEEMTELLLKKLLGNLDLRYGVMDVRGILYFLDKALRYHETHKKDNVIITLKSKHCLTIKISGCFCQPGFVENAGQCVRPFDCINNPLHTDYLERIVIA